MIAKLHRHSRGQTTPSVSDLRPRLSRSTDVYLFVDNELRAPEAAAPLLVVDVMGTIETRSGDPLTHVVSWVRQRIEAGAEVIVWSGLGQSAAQRCIDAYELEGARAWSKTDFALLIEETRGRDTIFVDDDEMFCPPSGSALVHPHQLRHHAAHPSLSP